ncbi:MAG: cysteine peptidase family C39 domain-containing protein, partial [Stellaceae bacterium]
MGEQGTSRDTGLEGLAMLLRFHGVAIEPQQLRHRLGLDERMGVPDILRAARALGLKARRVTTRLERLASTPLPALGLRRDARFFILAKVADGRALIHDPAIDQSIAMARGEFEAIWSGELVLMQRR